MDVNLPYVSAEIDRHGRRRIYVRRFGRRVCIREQPGTVAFTVAYNEALETLAEKRGAVAAPKRSIAREGTLGWLTELYFASGAFRSLASRSQATRRGIIEACLREPLSPKTPDMVMRDCPLRAIGPQHIRMLRDRKDGLPGAANNRMKYLSAMFGWAIEENRMRSNPCGDVKRVRYKSEGFHTWTIEEVEQFVARHPRGTKAHLAVALLLFLGARPSDTAKLGRQHLKGDTIAFVPSKTRHIRPELSYKPVLPILREVLEASPLGELTFLTTEHGRPFTDKGFGNKIRQWCDEAGLPHCSAHGLRKAGATIAAENGATVNELMALYDWSTARQAETYTRQADRRRMAKAAGSLITLDRSGNEDCRTLPSRVVAPIGKSNA